MLSAESSWISRFFLGHFAPHPLDRGMEETTRDHGLQPLDGLMERWNLTNHDLVGVSAEQLNHKQVQRARKGRQLTLHLMQKVARALNEAVLGTLGKESKPAFVPYLHRQLFSYAKGYDAAAVDANEPLMPQ